MSCSWLIWVFLNATVFSHRPFSPCWWSREHLQATFLLLLLILFPFCKWICNFLISGLENGIHGVSKREEMKEHNFTLWAAFLGYSFIYLFHGKSSAMIWTLLLSSWNLSGSKLQTDAENKTTPLAQKHRQCVKNIFVSSGNGWHSKTTFCMHPSIFFCASDSGSLTGRSLSQLSQGERQGTPRTGHQPVTRLYREANMLRCSHLANLESPVNI